MPVLLDVAFNAVVLAHDSGHIPDAGHLAADGVAEDNLVGYLLFGVVGGLDMNRYLLVVVADAAAEGGNALRLQVAEEHLLTDAVGLEALAVDIE